MKKKIFIAIAAILVLMQAIRLEKNEGDVNGPNALVVSGEVQAILEKSCYDCHSNKTNYPWYSNIQPVGWWLQYHVNDGKKHFNLSEFNAYDAKKKAHKMEEMGEMLAEHEMPLNSYLWIHKDAALTAEQMQLLTDWAKSVQIQYSPGGVIEEEQHN
jgi:hypothetical protein